MDIIFNSIIRNRSINRIRMGKEQEMTDEKYICQCCGGRIDRKTMTCEYCGTQYKEEYSNVLKVEMFQNPVRTLATRIVIDDFAMRTSPKDYSEFAIKELARQFAECIAPYMDIQHTFDSRTRISRLDAKIKVVEPINKPMEKLRGIYG